jgi:hypothetical protein
MSEHQPLRGDTTKPDGAPNELDLELYGKGKIISFYLGPEEYFFKYHQSPRNQHTQPADATLIDIGFISSFAREDIKGGGMGMIFPIMTISNVGAEDAENDIGPETEVQLVAKVPKVARGFTAQEIMDLFGLDESWTEKEIQAEMAKFSWYALGAPRWWLDNLADMRASQNKTEELAGGDQLDPDELAQNATTGKVKNKYRLDQLGHLLNEAYILDLLASRYCKSNPLIHDLRFFEVTADDHGKITFMPFIVMEQLPSDAKPLTEYFSEIHKTIARNNSADETPLDEKSEPYINAATSLQSLAMGLSDFAGPINIDGNYKPLVINGDLKPDHLLLVTSDNNDDGGMNQAEIQLRIVDFGLGMVLLTESGGVEYDSPWSSTAKTPGYSPLEKLLGDHSSPEKHDPYSIAKIVCELLSGGKSQVFDYQEVRYILPGDADTEDAYETHQEVSQQEARTRKVAVRVNENFQNILMETWRLQEDEAKTVMGFINKYLQPLPNIRASNPAVLPLLVSELISAVVESNIVYGELNYDVDTVLDLMKLNTGGAEVDMIYRRLGPNSLRTAAEKTITRIAGVLVADESINLQNPGLRKNALLNFLHTEGKNSGDASFNHGINPITVVGKPPIFDETSLDTGAPYRPRPQIGPSDGDTKPSSNSETEP